MFVRIIYTMKSKIMFYLLFIVFVFIKVSILLEEIEKWMKKSEHKQDKSSTLSKEKSSSSLTKRSSKSSSPRQPPQQSQSSTQPSEKQENEVQNVFDLFDSAGIPVQLNEHKTSRAIEFLKVRETYVCNYRNPADPIPTQQPQKGQVAKNVKR